MIVDIVDMIAADGVSLAGLLLEPPRPSDRTVQAVVLNPGTAGTFYRPLMQAMAAELHAAGYAALAISTRGHDLIARDVRSRQTIGAAYERIADCRYDFEAAFAELARRGYERIALLGHSLGGTKALWYLAHDPDSRVRAVISCSGPRWSASPYLASPDAAAFQRSRDHAERLVAAGTPDALFEAEFPKPDGTSPNLLTAANFIDKYAAETYNLDIWCDRITVPILRTEGDLERGTVQRGVADALKRLAVRSPRVDVAVIPGGDHFYSGLESPAGRIAAEWLNSL